MKASLAVRVPKKVRFGDVEAELWRLYFAALKCVLILAASIMHFVMIALFFIVQRMALVSETFLVIVTEWSPEKPSIFDSSQQSREHKSGELYT